MGRRRGLLKKKGGQLNSPSNDVPSTEPIVRQIELFLPAPIIPQPSGSTCSTEADENEGHELSSEAAAVVSQLDGSTSTTPTVGCPSSLSTVGCPSSMSNVDCSSSMSAFGFSKAELQDFRQAISAPVKPSLNPTDGENIVTPLDDDDIAFALPFDVGTIYEPGHDKKCEFCEIGYLRWYNWSPEYEVLMCFNPLCEYISKHDFILPSRPNPNKEILLQAIMQKKTEMEGGFCDEFWKPEAWSSNCEDMDIYEVVEDDDTEVSSLIQETQAKISDLMKHFAASDGDE